MLISFITIIQGDTSRCSFGSVDIKSKVALWYKEHMLKHNFCFHVITPKGNNVMWHPVSYYMGLEMQNAKRNGRTKYAVRLCHSYVLLITRQYQCLSIMFIEMSNSFPPAHRPPSPAVQQLPAAPGAQRVLRHVALPHRQPAHDPRAPARQEVSTKRTLNF